MFKSIEIEKFRGINQLKIDNLGQVNLLVGKNNCGKTTVLEALFLLIGATNPQLALTTNSMRGVSFVRGESWSTFFHNLDDSDPIRILARTHDQEERHELVLRTKTKELVRQPLESESEPAPTPSESQPTFVAYGLEQEYTSSKEPTHPSSIYEENGERIRTEGTKPAPIHGLFLGAGVQMDQPAGFDKVQKNRQVPEVVSLLKEIDPTISDLRITSDRVLVVETDLPRLLPVNLMGGGIVKALSVALAMLNCQDGVLLIDEIENGLHHSVQESVWAAIFRWAENLNVQVFATTHSYECIKAFCANSGTSLFESKAKAFRIERKEDEMKAVEMKSDQLAVAVDSMWEVR